MRTPAHRALLRFFIPEPCLRALIQSLRWERDGPRPFLVLLNPSVPICVDAPTDWTHAWRRLLILLLLLLRAWDRRRLLID